MKNKVFRLFIDAENAAFGNDPAIEIVRILRECANRIERDGVGFPSETIRDSNGNDVGRYALKTLQQWGNCGISYPRNALHQGRK